MFDESTPVRPCKIAGVPSTPGVGRAAEKAFSLIYAVDIQNEHIHDQERGFPCNPNSHTVVADRWINAIVPINTFPHDMHQYTGIIINMYT